MNYIKFKEALQSFQVFSTSDIRGAFGSFDRRRLTEWQKKGYILKLTKGNYLFSDTVLDETTLSKVANKIYRPSYISFETALSQYRLIPESVYLVTSAATRRTYLFQTPVARFSYRQIKPELFFGYNLLPGGVKVAYMEKAILDYLYINPLIRTEEDYASLRINGEELLSRLDEERFSSYLRRFDQKRLSIRAQHLLDWLAHA